MTSAIVTTSYAPDFDRFARLHKSVIEHTDLVHHVFVPAADRELFAPLDTSDRLVITTTRSILPRNFMSTEWINRAVARIPHAPGALRWAALNTRRPFPPIRGWILQQIVKFAAAEYVEADTLIYLDSEIQLVRDIEDSTFRRDGVSRLFRRRDGISGSMTRHQEWHARARRLIGAQADGRGAHDDYIGGITTWDAAMVRQCLSHIATLSGRPWQTVLGAELDFSEYVLYGEYAAEHGTERQLSFTSDRTLCHSYWESAPLDLHTAKLFIETMDPDDVALHIQSNSHTPAAIERYIVDAVRAQ
jgi:hypothetical protein